MNEVEKLLNKVVEGFKIEKLLDKLVEWIENQKRDVTNTVVLWNDANGEFDVVFPYGYCVSDLHRSVKFYGDTLFQVSLFDTEHVVTIYHPLGKRVAVTTCAL